MYQMHSWCILEHSSELQKNSFRKTASEKQLQWLPLMNDHAGKHKPAFVVDTASNVDSMYSVILYIIII